LPESIHDGYVTFSEVEGMYAKDEKTLAELGLNINVSGPWKVTHNTRTVMRKQRDGSMKEETVFDPYSFKIGDTSNLSPYCGRGFVTQFKKPSAVSARSLGATLQQPLSNGTDAFSFCAVDGNKFFRGLNLHFALQVRATTVSSSLIWLCLPVWWPAVFFCRLRRECLLCCGWQAVWEYEAMHGSLPRVGDAAAADAVVKIAEATNAAMKHLQKVCGGDVAASLEELDADAVRTYALYAAAEVQPMAAFFGGVTAQEVVKACAKFRPMDQWLHFDAFEILPETPYSGPVPEDSRYAHEISVFGPDVVSTLRKQKTFLVGCGALGCEFLKNFALMGLATSEGGMIHCTDNDRIEVRQHQNKASFCDAVARV
jgi:ubiquitin-activating enzyme E1